MPKKSTNAKERQDKYYWSAKEQGYRARSAFKLEQINQVCGNFMKKHKLCIDLCAAPGSWMQKAREMMPSGGFVIGVDLVKIREIPGCHSIVGDITTESLRSELRTQLKTYKADVVLHDGAPKTTGTYVQDAYDQCCLTLHALKLACEFLRPGGDFITKVFRSKDSANLDYVFRQLFKHVQITKPAASRYESAETYFYCNGYKKTEGTAIDPNFFNPHHVFKENEPTAAAKIDLRKPEKIMKKALGYEDGVEILFKEFTMTEYIEAESADTILEQASAITFDDDRWLNHPSTTQEIVTCFSDIKLLNRKDIRRLKIWREKIKKELAIDLAFEKKEETKKIEDEKTMEEKEEEIAEKEMEELEKQMAELEAEAKHANKKREKAIRKKQQQLNQKMRKINLMQSETDDPEPYFNIQDMEQVEDEDLINKEYDTIKLKTKESRPPNQVKFRKGEDYELAEDGVTWKKIGEDDSDESDDEIEEEEEGVKTIFKKNILNQPSKDGFEVVAKDAPPKKKVTFAGFDDSSEDEDDTQKAIEEEADSGVEDEDEEDAPPNPLTTDLVGDIAVEKRERRSEKWFERLLVPGPDSDAEDEDLEVANAVAKYRSMGGVVDEGEIMSLDDEVEEPPKKKKKVDEEEEEESETVEIAEEQSNPKPKVYSKDDLKKMLSILKSLKSQGGLPSGAFNASEHLPKKAKRFYLQNLLPDLNTVNMSEWGPEAVMPKKDLPELTSAGLAYASEVVRSIKSRRDAFNKGWNRYMREDDEEQRLPKWFLADEAVHQCPDVFVDQKLEKYYDVRNRGVNVRTLKKVMEAKARKKRRFKKTMQNVIKKTEAMAGSSAISDRDKQQEVAKLYKKAMKQKVQKEKTYVVMSKKNKGKAPKGIKGRKKLVDPRMKKDVRAKMKLMKKNKTYNRKKSKK